MTSKSTIFSTRVQANLTSSNGRRKKGPGQVFMSTLLRVSNISPGKIDEDGRYENEVNKNRTNVRTRAKKNEEEKQEEGEEKFVDINSMVADRFGPDKMLLLGFTPTEFEKIRKMMDRIGADFVELVVVSKEIYERCTLEQALQSHDEEDGDSKKNVFSASGVSSCKIVIMSGMIGAEVVEVIDAFKEIDGIGAMPAFACAVPNSWKKPLKQTIDEISGDHESMMMKSNAR